MSLPNLGSQLCLAVLTLYPLCKTEKRKDERVPGNPPLFPLQQECFLQVYRLVFWVEDFNKNGFFIHQVLKTHWNTVPAIYHFLCNWLHWVLLLAYRLFLHHVIFCCSTGDFLVVAHRLRLAALWAVESSSLTRNQTCTLCIARQILNVRTTREVPWHCCLWPHGVTLSPLFTLHLWLPSL